MALARVLFATLLARAVGGDSSAPTFNEETPFEDAALSLLAVKTQLLTRSLVTEDLALHLLQQGGDSLSADTRELLTSLRTCFDCSSGGGAYVRVGSAGDGGYVMCQGQPLSGIQAAFSFGVNGQDDWATGLSPLIQRKPIYAFDCFNTKEPPFNPAEADIRFNRECISADGKGEEGKVFRTLADHLERHAPAKAGETGDLLLKVDVEGSEWGVFKGTDNKVMQRARQIIVEFHNLKQENLHGEHLQDIKHILDAGFAVSHLHGNNYASTGKFQDFSVPDVLEVTFVNLAFAQGAGSVLTPKCAGETRLPQDAPNNKQAADLQPADLPAAA